MVAVADQRQHDVVGRKMFEKLQRMLIGNIGVAHALQDVNGAAGGDDTLQHAVLLPVLHQRAGEDVGLGAIFRMFLEITLFRQRGFSASERLGSIRLLREIRRWRNEDETGDGWRATRLAQAPRPCVAQSIRPWRSR